MFEAMIDPTARPATSATGAALAPRPARLAGLTVGLLANTKKNAEPFLDEVGELLTAEYGVRNLVRRKKLDIAKTAPAEMRAELADACDVVVVGVGDCGSCSASAVADGLELEAAGVPAVVICSEAFAATADAMADLKGAKGYGYTRTPHPVAPLERGEVRERARRILPDLVGILTGRATAAA
ncbi:UGSC family (seleno)protein [Amycolatopsis sp. GM8]|uniref:UGSC family (seleno)protein n=1 Tax=Amycolatopsis sp. GM8 TaxID=2896530 RepID=UPI001F3F6572|nr:UGSC family (seleno)protein [Amycolatopsis sp. GM8]